MTMLTVGEIPQSLAFINRRFSGFKKGVEGMPHNMIVIAPDSSIIAASDMLMTSTYKTQKQILNRGLFEVYPACPDDPDCVERLAASFGRVIERQRVDIMEPHRYDIPLPKAKGGGFEERYWKNVSYPIFDRKGNLLYIVLNGEDVTKQMQLRRQELLRNPYSAA